MACHLQTLTKGADGPGLLQGSTRTNFLPINFFQWLATATYNLSAEEKVHTFSSSCLDDLRQPI